MRPAVDPEHTRFSASVLTFSLRTRLAVAHLTALTPPGEGGD